MYVSSDFQAFQFTHMRFSLLSPALLAVFLLIRCAAVPMPAVVVPARGNSLEATLYAGNNGFGVNGLYATKRLTLVDVALQESPISTDSRAYDVGIGQVFIHPVEKTSMMLMITGGYGKYTAYPIVLGATSAIYEVNSDALRLSLYGNWQFERRKGGVIGQLSIFDGKSRQNRINGPSVEQHDFISVGVELIFYSTPGKRRHFLMGAGLGLSTGNRKNSGAGEILKDFNPSPINLFIGYPLAKNPPPSPLPLSQ